MAPRWCLWLWVPLRGDPRESQGTPGNPGGAHGPLGDQVRQSGLQAIRIFHGHLDLLSILWHDDKGEGVHGLLDEEMGWGIVHLLDELLDQNEKNK